MVDPIPAACSLRVGPLQIWPDEYLARASGRALMLSPRELCVLTELARRADHIVTREDLSRWLAA